MAEAPVLRVVQVSKSFPALGRTNASAPAAALTILNDLSFDLHAGEMLAIVGESGSGKSSLLHLLALLDRPTTGEIWFGGRNIATLKPEAAARLRNQEIGYVWQFHYLLPEFTAGENVALPLLARGMERKQALKMAGTWLARVGLEGREHHRSGELSGGEQQRVSMARALVTEPRLLLADEPTGDLDNTTAERIFTLLRSLTLEHRLATVLVTHNLTFAERSDRALRLHAGRLVSL